MRAGDSNGQFSTLLRIVIKLIDNTTRLSVLNGFGAENVRARLQCV